MKIARLCDLEGAGHAMLLLVQVHFNDARNVACILRSDYASESFKSISAHLDICALSADRKTHQLRRNAAKLSFCQILDIMMNCDCE